MFEENDYLTVNPVNISFSDVINKEYINTARRDELLHSNILILPLENFRETAPLCFHHGTRQAYLFFKENYSEAQIDICTDKDKYSEISLHSDEFRLGTFLLECIFAPTFVSVLSYYIINFLSRKKDDKVTVNIILVEDKNSDKGLEIKYKGSPAEIEEKLISQITLYTKSGKINKNNTQGTEINELR
jgi:hypothetical protein